MLPILILFSIFFFIHSEFINYEEEDHIAIITINRPKALNALNSQVLDEIDKTLDAINTKKIRALIITGEGQKSFVAGADIAEMSKLSKKEGEAFSAKGNKVFRKIEKFPIPVIAAINGYALGGGCEIAMSCDIRICSDNAIFGQPEVGLGITPGFGGTQRLARLIGMGMAKQMIYTGKNIMADEAFRIGLVNAIYPQQELLGEAKKLALNIAKNGANAVQSCKKAINDGLQVSIDKAIKIEERIFGQCFETPEQIEGMQNFLNRGKKGDKKNDKKEPEKKEEIEVGKLIPTNVFKDMVFLDTFSTPKMPAILTAGDKNSHNSCMIGWGLLGSAWTKPLFIVLVKPERYTYEFMEKTQFFTVNFIKKEYQSKFAPYGNQSGRDINKEEVSGTHIQFLDNGGITFKEAEEVYVCKMFAKTYLEKENMSQELLDIYEKFATQFKQNTVPHALYIGEIIEHYQRENI